MFRILNSRSSSYSTTISLVRQFSRPLSTPTKAAPARPVDQKTNSRRIPTFPPRQVDLQKLFSDEPKDSTVSRRTTRTGGGASSSPVGNRYEDEIKHVDDYQVEERRRLSSTRVKNQETKKLQAEFDGLELIESKFDEKNHEQRRRTNVSKGSDSDQPRQPRKEKALSDQFNQSSINVETNDSSSKGILTEKIQATKNIDDLLNIFDQYILPTEFALGLQKFCQMASIENSDTVHLYHQADKQRQRLETLLLSFLNKFNDHEVVRAIAFVTKFYPEDNEFTDKFSLALNNRLRRISVHQIINMLDELKVSRHTAQWIHRTYNRLLSLAEGRYFEFDNIKDILSLTYKFSFNDRLINRLDERILEIADSLTFDDWFKVLVNKSMLKRRDRTIIRAACYHLLKLSESSLFPLDKIKDSLLACAMLNVYDRAFLERLVHDAFEQVEHIKDPFILQSIITSMGTLRLRHSDLLETFSRILLEESKSLGTSKDKCLHALIRTCAAVNFLPSTLTALIKNHLNIESPTTATDEENNPLVDVKNRIDLVWSLAILDQADSNHLNIVLNPNVFQLIQNEVANSKIASALKLLAIYSYSLQKFSKKFLKPTFNVEQLAQLLTVKNANAQDQLAKTVVGFAAENKYSKFNVVTSNMIVIDCLMVVDKNGTPQDLSTILSNAESNAQTSFNKMRVNDQHIKIVLKCLDYQDKTLLSETITGPLALQMRLLTSLGYKCVPIHYDEFIKIQSPDDRMKYVRQKIKEAINPNTTNTSTTSADRPTTSSTNRKKNKDDDHDDW